MLVLLNDNSTGNSNSSTITASQYAAQYRAMSHMYATDPSTPPIYPYHSLYSGNAGGLTAPGTNSNTGNGGGTSDQAIGVIRVQQFKYCFFFLFLSNYKCINFWFANLSENINIALNYGDLSTQLLYSKL